MEVRARRQRQLLGTTAAIHPEQRTGTPDGLTRYVRKIARGGDVEVRDAGVAAHEDALHHGEGLPRNLEPIGIEPNGEQIAVTRVDEMTGW